MIINARRLARFSWLALLAGLFASLSPAQAQTAPLTNTVTAPNLTFYLVNGAANPTLTLLRGVTYVFQVNVSGIHPFYIKTNATIGSGNMYNVGVTGQGATTTPLTFAVPVNAPNKLFYHCGTHQTMGGELNITNAPTPPPSGQIVYIMLAETHVEIRSIGATGWSPLPEFSSNLTENAWSSVVDFTNNFASGTNTTTFNRLDAICGPNVFIRVRNQQN
jgi:hypothetical protein